MGLQTIVNNCNSLEVNRRKLVGIQYTRNQSSKVSLTPTLNPWRFTLQLPTNLRYADARGLLEEIDSLDRIYPEVIKFTAGSNLNWFFRYQGQATLPQLGQIKVESFVGNQLTLSNLPAISNTAILFAKNDLIQIAGSPHPFTSTTNVERGIGNTVVITTHRPNFITAPVAGLNITVGSYCDFIMFCPNMPTYKLNVGGAMYDADGVMFNNAYIEWSTEFKLYEYLADL